MYEGGMENVCYLILNIVEFGDYVLGLCVIILDVKENMKVVLIDI